MFKRKTIEEFITDARKVHGDKYDYSKVEYINNKTKVCIICPIHGEFWQCLDKHINRKSGCPICAQIQRKFNKLIPIEIKLQKIRKYCLDNNLLFLGFCEKNGKPCELD